MNRLEPLSPDDAWANAWAEAAAETTATVLDGESA
jgi:hypothetical protein